MPTPNNTAPAGAPQTVAPEAVHRQSARLQAACPEDYLQMPSRTWTYLSHSAAINPRDQPTATTAVINAAASPPATFPSTPSSSSSSSSSPAANCVESSARTTQSPPTTANSASPKLEATSTTAATSSSPPTDLIDPTISLGHNFSLMRLYPSITSTFLRPMAKFEGKQKNEKQSYSVNVTLQQVDMNNSFVCGYLRIQGLTDDHPTLTTYFEGQIIGPTHPFLTSAWNATDEDDLAHWRKFPSFRSYFPTCATPSHLKKASHSIRKDYTKRDYIFMRWKELFLVPDHTKKELVGASFEGFYYIAFNQRTGAVSGYYYHANSNKDQQLELEYVEERCVASFEFR